MKHHWNDGDWARMPELARARASLRVVIGALPERIMDALARTGEGAWHSGWTADARCSLAVGADGRALWAEDATGLRLFGRPGCETLWYPTLCDPARRATQVTLLSSGQAIGDLRIALSPEVGGTAVALDLTYTSLSEAGNDFFCDDLTDRMESMLGRLGTSLADHVQSPHDEDEGATAARAGSAWVRVSHSVVVDKVRQEQFALACPVAELEWIDGWHFDLLYSDSGVNEVGCMFHEPFSGPMVLRHAGAPTCWYTTLFDPDTWRFNAVLTTGDLVAALFEFSADQLDGDSARLTWRLTYVATSEAGEALLREPGMKDRMKQMLGFLSLSIKTYVETGQVYRLPHRRKAGVAFSLIYALLARHLRAARQRIHGG